MAESIIRRIVDVDTVAANENMTAFVNDNGAIKQVPIGEVGGPKMPEPTGANRQLVTDADGVAKWEDKLPMDYTLLNNRPTIPARGTITINWDGDKANRPSLLLGFARFCKVSDIVLDGTQISSVMAKCATSTTVYDQLLPGTNCYTIGEASGYAVVLIAPVAGECITGTNKTINVPSSGIYFRSATAAYTKECTIAGVIPDYALQLRSPDGTPHAVTMDESGMLTVDEKKVEGLPSGASAHQYLTTGADGKAMWEEKIVYENRTIDFTWDGDMNDDIYNTRGAIYRISTDVTTLDQFDGVKFRACSRKTGAISDEYTVNIAALQEGIGGRIMAIQGYHMVRIDIHWSETNEDEDIGFAVFPNAGMSANDTPGLYGMTSDAGTPFASEVIKGTTKTLDEKYIPNTIARKTDIPVGGGLINGLMVFTAYESDSSDDKVAGFDYSDADNRYYWPVKRFPTDVVDKLRNTDNGGILALTMGDGTVFRFFSRSDGPNSVAEILFGASIITHESNAFFRDEPFGAEAYIDTRYIRVILSGDEAGKAIGVSFSSAIALG